MRRQRPQSAHSRIRRSHDSTSSLHPGSLLSQTQRASAANLVSSIESKRLARPASAGDLKQRKKHATPSILQMSTSLAMRWSKHLKTQGLDPEQARRHNQEQHVERVRGAAASQAALLSQAAATAQAAQSYTHKKRPQSAPGQRRKNLRTNHKQLEQSILQSEQQLPPFSTFDERKNNQAPVVGIRDFINNVRTIRRKNIIHHTNSYSNEAMKEEIESKLRQKHYEEMAKLKHTLTQMKLSNNDLADQNKNLSMRLQAATEETSSLSFNVTMLRKRLQLLTSREIDNQRRLETFSRFAPLFDALDAYSSPADALRRLSVLEKEQSSNFAEVRQAEDNLKQTTGYLTSLNKAANATIEELKVKLLESRKIAEVQISTLKQDLHTAKLDVKSLESYRTKYLETQTAVRGCYERALKACSLFEVDDPRLGMTSEKNIANIGHPLQMLEHLGLLFEASTPTAASMRVHMLTGTINRMWLDLTGDDDSSSSSSSSSSKEEKESKKRDNESSKLLFRPEDILKKVGKKIQVVNIREKNTSAKLSTTQIRLTEAENELKTMEKNNVKMDLEINRLRKLLKK
jgi:hypothetical protein